MTIATWHTSMISGSDAPASKRTTLGSPQLLPHEQVLCHQPTHATRPGQSGKHGEKVNQKDQRLRHRATR